MAIFKPLLLEEVEIIIVPILKASSGNYYFIPYIVLPCGTYLYYENDAQNQASVHMQPNWEAILRPLCMPLVDRFISLLKDIHVTSCTYYKEALLNDIRNARVKYQDNELAMELARIKRHMNNIEVMTSDIIINLLLSYRDIQDYDAMVKLIETLEMLPMCNVADQHNIKFHYAFALNRRNGTGDREKALQVMLQVLQSCDHPAPDMFCLCGRIYKDMFLDSEYEDDICRDKAITWYRKGFELQPSLYSGINLSILLIVAGQHFETSTELRKIGIQLNDLLGRKGSLEKMNNYWDVGYFFTITVLANNVEKAVQAAERLFRLKPPVWYLRSLVQNLLLILCFKKLDIEYSSRQEQFNFWLDIIFEATTEVTDGLRFPVLVIEPTKIYQPAYVSISSEAEERTVFLWHVSPSEMTQIHEWNFTASSIKGISLSKFDGRCCFLYIYNNSDDFQICFSTENQCSRFCYFVKEMLTNAVGPTVELDRETDGDILEYEYDRDANGERIILGKGTYGIVYSGQDLRNQVQIAIKEIPERDCRRVGAFYILHLTSSTPNPGPTTDGSELAVRAKKLLGYCPDPRVLPVCCSQPLHEEIALHKYLKHPNIIQYLGSVSEGGYIKIFMEQVPGGSLSALLQSKWGPMKEPTIKFYTKQILEGLKYLHENQIVHRDIKGDNVLVNTYSGVVKISDFGTSKHLAGVNPCTETFTGTLQYMAPEIIDQGPRGYGAPADIWSLGCTIIEMATGRPPFRELGEPQAAMFGIGLLKMHPNIPRTLSFKAMGFILACFEPNPSKRVTAAGLLTEDFLRQTNKGERKQIAFRPSAGAQCATSALALPFLGEPSGRNSSEHGSISQDSGAQPDTFPEDAHAPKHQLSHLLSVPEQSSALEDQGTASSREDRDPGLLLHEDSEHCAILHKILLEEQSQVASNLQECVSQVNKILRNQLIRPHCMFAMDNITHRAVQAADTTLTPELRAHFEPPSEMEGDNGMDEMEEDNSLAHLPGGEACVASKRRHGSVVMQEAPPQQEQEQEQEQDQEQEQEQEQEQQQGLQLNMLKEETIRLLEHLVQKEREYQNFLQLTLEQKTQQLHHLQLQYKSNGTAEIPAPPHLQGTNNELIAWLQGQGADANTIEKIVEEDYTLSDILNNITKEDLRCLQLRGGVLCRLWQAISQYRRQAQESSGTAAAPEDSVSK
ncbi:Mitogen-activated protein kinase kinase kinase 15 [Heterocephalus glaber]|uniref:mitogen-activated protein kinase kinase kinase n=1 Tax=Heterocephalus glaber TaxID=10181 RepID=G5BZ39_HETGA|nr:Mitogen-activated protein kinase kinase kinase 15 [Heterocephalus glaber]